MDARERLRQYLEQRRETGETELVLDTLSVEDVMRMIGVPNDGGMPSSASAGRPQREAPVEPRLRDAGTTGTSDWRSELRASGAGPTRASESLPRDPAPRAGSTPPPAPPTPDAPVPNPIRLAESADTPPAVRKTAGSRYAFGPPDDAPPPPDASDPGPGRIANASPGSKSPPKPIVAAPPAIKLDDVPHGIVIGSPSSAPFDIELGKLPTLADLAKMVEVCTRCVLYKTARHAVPGEGSANADLVCVGEAPGQTEDELGRPFVGQAGQLLNKILGAIDLQREDVFICNVLKHRPPGNRNPLPNEVEACSPYLVRQLGLIKPKVIVAFGTFAAQTLLNTTLALGKLRGSIHHYYGIPLIVTYHPAALLRNPAWKRPTWEDVQLARRILDRARGV